MRFGGRIEASAFDGKKPGFYTMDDNTGKLLIERAEKYNDRQYFTEDPIIFPRHFAEMYASGQCGIADVEIAAAIAAHLAWGRRSMIVRDCGRAFDEMDWKPFGYVMAGEYRDDAGSLHRTVRWSEFAQICGRLRGLYSGRGGKPESSLEGLSDTDFRVLVYGQKPDPKAPDKKINMMRRWLTRDDGRVDLGIWRHSDKKKLLIPLDVHVYDVASELGLTARRQKDRATAEEITGCFRGIFPDDPCLGDFALFGYGIDRTD